MQWTIVVVNHVDLNSGYERSSADDRGVGGEGGSRPWGLMCS